MTQYHELKHRRWSNYQNLIVVIFFTFIGYINSVDINIILKIYILFLLSLIFFIIFYFIDIELNETESDSKNK